MYLVQTLCLKVLIQVQPVAYPGIFLGRGEFNKFSRGQRTENGNLGAVTH